MADITTGRQVDFRFLETSGTSVADFSGNSRTGTWVGTANVSPVAGPYPGLPGFSFNASSNEITFTGLAASLGTDCTLTWWMKQTLQTPVSTALTGFGNFGAIIASAGQFHATHVPYTDGNAYLGFARASSNTVTSRFSAGAMPGGTTRTNWNFYAITNTSGVNGYKFYENCVLVAQTTGITPYWDDDLWSFGRSRGYNGTTTQDYWYNGSLANPRIYSRTLSLDDLTALMSYTGQPSIVSHYNRLRFSQ